MDILTPGHIILVLVAALLIFGPKRPTPQASVMPTPPAPVQGPVDTPPAPQA